MTSTPLYEQVAERVELLLARHVALQQSHQALARELAACRQARDMLEARLAQAGLRLEGLLAQLPGASPETSRDNAP